MKAAIVVAVGIAVALPATGTAPVLGLVSEANAKPPSNPSKGKKRASRPKSKAKAAGKVSTARKQGNSGKKRARAGTGRRATSAVPASSSRNTEARPRRATARRGAGSRISMTAVSSAPLSANRSTPNAAPSQRASLDVNTSSRSTRVKRVTKRSNVRRGTSAQKKRSRTSRGRNAKTALQTAAQPSLRKVTFNLTPQVQLFRKDAPANRLGSGVPDNRSSVSTVLSRRPMEMRQQSRIRRIVGSIKQAMTWRRPTANPR